MDSEKKHAVSAAAQRHRENENEKARVRGIAHAAAAARTAKKSAPGYTAPTKPQRHVTPADRLAEAKADAVRGNRPLSAHEEGRILAGHRSQKEMK
jgi:hypothetical protein